MPSAQHSSGAASDRNEELQLQHNDRGAGKGWCGVARLLFSKKHMGRPFGHRMLLCWPYIVAVYKSASGVDEGRGMGGEAVGAGDVDGDGTVSRHRTI
jgi:hypothetical protein